MTLQLTQALRYQGVKSDWLASLPSTGTEILVISSSGVVAHQAMPSGGSFGDLTGLPSDNAALQSALDAKAATIHTHVIADTTGLQTALDAKAATIHTHVIADTTGLQSALNAKLNLSGGAISGPLTASSGSLASSVPYQFNQTWNNAAVQFVGFYVQVTDTASNANSIIAAFGTNVNDLWTIRKDGALLLRGNANNTGLYSGGGTMLAIRAPNNGRGIAVDGWGQRLIIDALSQGVQWDSGAPFIPSLGSIDFRNGTTATSWRYYRTYTSGSVNHHYAIITNNGSNQYDVGTVNNGVGNFTTRFLNNGTAMIEFGNDNTQIILRQRSLTFGSANSGEVVLRQVTAFSGVLNVIDALSASTYNDIALRQLIVGGAAGATTSRIKNTSGTVNFRLGNDSADANITAASAVFSGLVTVGTYTVATLPSAAANAGALAQVTDSSVTANGSAVAGGGANRAVVFSNGSSWKVVVA